MIRVLLADDQQVIRLGFRMMIDGDESMAVVGEAADGAAAVRSTAELLPDVVLMDVRMPVMDGIAATRAITESCPDTRVLVVTTFDLDEYVIGALRAGAAGFLLKDIEPSALIEGIHTVVRGDALVASEVTRALIDYAVRRVEPPEPTVDPRQLEQLSSREREVFTSMAHGMSNAQIARALFLGETTVKWHVSNILGKLHLCSRVQAVVFAYEAGVVRPGEIDHGDLLGGR